MAKQALFTMKLEPELHAAFMAEAQASHQSAAQITRELMRDYVARQQEERAYKAFLDQKVGAARASLATGNGLTAEDVEARMAARRRQATS